MASWAEFEAAEADFAARVKGYLRAHVHMTLATVRKDGSPRISGTEIAFKEGEVWLGSMLDALKARDLRRDPRYAVHGGSDDPPAWKGDAKFSGVVEELTTDDAIRAINGPEHVGKSHLFRCELHEVSIVYPNDAGDAIIVEIWKPGEPLRAIERD